VVAAVGDLRIRIDAADALLERAACRGHCRTPPSQRC
jgi:hypothetical protein